jgi:rRNA maturation endonuclease Nob1
MDDLRGVDADVLRAQLRARRTMKREVRWFYAVLLVGTLVYFVFNRATVIGLAVYLLFVAAVRTATVWYQWDFLARFQLTCPHCQKALATRTSYLKSPTHNCPHCGKQALAPIRQLVEFEELDRE